MQDSPPGATRRGPRNRKNPENTNQLTGLSRTRIVEAALQMIELDGLAGLGIRKLGDKLNCEAMSIYHYFPSKQHLLDGLVDHAIASVAVPPENLSAIERLRACMHAFRAMAHRHAALFPLIATHRLNTPTGVRFIESILRLVQAVVPDPEKSARYFRILGYYLMGAGLDETAGYAKGPSAAEPASEAFIVSECPRLMGVGRWFQRDEWDETFVLGVEVLLDAMQRDSLRGCE